MIKKIENQNSQNSSNKSSPTGPQLLRMGPKKLGRYGPQTAKKVKGPLSDMIEVEPNTKAL